MSQASWWQTQLAERAANIELKARDPAPGRTLAVAAALGARDRGSFNQLDTFFTVPTGRLTLREQDGEAELIEYERPDAQAPSRSVYRRLVIADPAATRELLATELGVVGVVEKRRHALVKDKVRIHLDRVVGLGSYVELAAPLPPGDEPSSQLGAIKALRRDLWIAEDQLVAGSYIDLLAAAERGSKLEEFRSLLGLDGRP
jgi:adenylate cyclase class 2